MKILHVAGWFVLLMAFAPPLAAQDFAARLREAAGAGRIADIRTMIASPGASGALDGMDAQGQTALLIAVQNGRTDAALALIAAGANINAQAQNKDTPWLLAGARGQTRMLKAMLDTGKVDYSIRNRFGGNALIPACERGHVDTVRLLVTESKIDVNHINNLGWTALMEAVLFGDDGPSNLEIVRLLVRHGADVNIADKSGITPLAHARLRKMNLVSQMLASNGAR